MVFKKKEPVVPVPSGLVLRLMMKREATLDLAEGGTITASFVATGLTPDGVEKLLSAIDDDGLLTVVVRGQGKNND